MDGQLDSSQDKKPPRKRGYRACLPCRSRKLKCDLGPDPDAPLPGPCRRCRRELRNCYFAEATGKKFERKPPNAVMGGYPAPDSNGAGGSSSSMNGNGKRRRSSSPVYESAGALMMMRDQRSAEGDDDDQENDGDGDEAGESASGSRDDNPLLSSALHNPRDALDALRMLASANETHQAHASRVVSPSENGHGRLSGNGWISWPPIKSGLLSQSDAQRLLKAFEINMAPLYPLLTPQIFLPSHLSTLISSESILLATMISISARYASPSSDSHDAAIHQELSSWIRREISFVMEGTPNIRNIGTVEALLLLSEWPPVPNSAASLLTAQVKEDESSADSILRPSHIYDSLSWAYIGCAVRLAQELGLDNQTQYSESEFVNETATWYQERTLQTWIYCYNADQHVSVRLGRNAVVQTYMSSQWWEKVCQISSDSFREKGFQSQAMSQGMLASLMGTIRDRLYANKEITRAILKTGHWEGFLRSLAAELQHMHRCSESILKQNDVSSILLEIEMSFIRLYGNAVSMRALQERFRRRVKNKDFYFVSATLLNLAEGPFLIEAIGAAQSILRSTVTFLAPKGYLRLCPARIFERIVFAATFLYKALAVGVIEHGHSTNLTLLRHSVDALESAKVDHEHISHGFAALLRRLQKHHEPAAHLTSSTNGREPTKESQKEASRRSEIIAEPPPVARTGTTHPFAPTPGNATPSVIPPWEEYSPFNPTSLPGPFPPTPFISPPSVSYATPFEWLPSTQLAQVEKEQDLLFQALWTTGDVNGNSGMGNLNLVGALCGDGDDFGF